MIFINIGYQIPGRNCFAIYIEDGNVFMNINGNETFDNWEDLKQECLSSNFSKVKINKLKRLYEKWSRDL